MILKYRIPPTARRGMVGIMEDAPPNRQTKAYSFMSRPLFFVK